MLKLIASLLSVAAIASNAHAFQLEASDNSQFTKACVAAAQSSDSLEDVLRDNNILAISKDQVLCNDTPIAEFIATLKKQENTNTNNNAKFRNANASNEAKLCIAAATSNEEFSKAKRRFLAKVHPKQVVCNGMALVQFAKQYNKSFNG
ncbi:hypothetical protein D210916BOD24_29990 [Alteromonas sp. D210916BOD_24]|uniref:hypothetical protein n=1 Tax=Alteromonas sp. D210916BOD_24 TaxID=3157618 RepID=UPI00399CDBF1